jgi:hypothetical protein
MFLIIRGLSSKTRRKFPLAVCVTCVSLSGLAPYRTRLKQAILCRPRQSRHSFGMARLILLVGGGDVAGARISQDPRYWGANQTSFPRENAEMAFAHAIGDMVEAADAMPSFSRTANKDERQSLYSRANGACRTLVDPGCGFPPAAVTKWSA